ncbi:MAG: polysaccharide deacetylase family protein [Candidatus Dormibacteraceae bacterium]
MPTGPSPKGEGTRAYSVRRSGPRVIVGVAIGCVVVLVCGLLANTGSLVPNVEFNGRSVDVHGQHLTLGKLLNELHLSLSRGVVLTAVTHRPIPGHWKVRPRLSVNGKPASMTTPVGPGARVTAHGGVAIEPVVSKIISVGSPGMPSIEFHLWHPGRRATEIERVGRYSGQVVTGPRPYSPALAATPVTEKEVALTFDGGPDPLWTPGILHVLQSEGVHATFCIIGEMAQDDPGLVRTEAQDGETLCDHTMTHDEYLPTAGHATSVSEIDGAAAVITKDSGGIAPRFYRPPGGFLTPQIISVANAAGMQVLYWDVDTVDWQDPPAQTIAARALQAGPGDIILFHDGAGDPANVIAALPTIINTFQARGYTFVTPGTVSPAPAPPGTPLPQTPIPPAIETGPSVPGNA